MPSAVFLAVSLLPDEHKCSLNGPKIKVRTGSVVQQSPGLEGDVPQNACNSWNPDLAIFGMSFAILIAGEEQIYDRA